ncbi:MAG: prepilin-type N-terminal cleavage/methylation domain-containing protein [Firmicutes bacterium]|jgi:prepilin-type N-terminal cleavage/methylation domain-containing protein|nr:prepilin-type N-terminal cleavage/methylation domain-containing protein [Bacillota bacterium]
MWTKEKENVNAGFTLVELLIVLVIIALAGVIAAPRVADTYREMRFNSISDQLLNDLRFARKSAMDLNTNIRVNFTGGVNYTITVANTGRQLRNRNYPESGAGWKITFGSTTQFFFNSWGLPHDGSGNPVGGKVRITGGSGQTREFTVYAATGMIR